MAGLEQVVAGLDALAAVDVTCLPAAALAESLVELDRVQARLAAEKARRLAAFDAAGGSQGDGSVTTASWLRQRCRSGHRDAATQVRVATELRALPATAAALAAGEISLAHAEAMTGVLTDAQARLDPVAAAGVEATLLEYARGVSVDLLRLLVRRLRERLDPDGELAKAEREFDRRWLSAAVTDDGLVYLKGLLDREGGAVLLAALDAVTPPPVDADPRTRQQARADALVELARRLLDAGTLPRTAGHRPHLTLTTDLPTLQRAAADLFRTADLGTGDLGTGDLGTGDRCTGDLVGIGIGSLGPAPGDRTGTEEDRPTATAREVTDTDRILAVATALLIPSPGGTADPASGGSDRAEEPGRGPDLAGILTGRAGASLGWTGPIPAATALRIACDATVTRLLFDPDGQPLHLGRTERLVSRGQWIALVARDGGCIAPGCHRPPEWCEAHHVVPWVLGGRTDIDKLALVCRIHHRHTHEGRWTVARDEHGRYTLQPPHPGTRRHAHRGRDPATGHAA